LYKAPKPGQDRRFDLPAIGPRTMEGAARAGLAGVAVEAGGVMALSLGEAVATADRLGLFIWGRKA
ncbi:MAG TPA: UDP-2,3-diacylglucosamine diphosphatase LpxI, partial [Paracoccaceae bacterium]|nr:UDP-2,3-diacylglucosamine diphosphatase LpxI [Paracoccaceae bacterium]